MNAITKGYQDVPMSRRRAQLLAEYADKLAEMLENAPDDQDLAEWVQSKIDRAASAIQSAYHYLDQEEEEDELEKAAGHKYTHRKRVGTDKRGRARYRYYYQEHHGGGITSAKFEAGSSFKLTFKGRRGHFHIQSVEGDMVTITHDGRPGMQPVSIHRDELRALLKKQHGKALEAHVEKRRREVEALDRDRSRKRSGLGLALHRLRQAADKAGISLPEQYQRKPKKTRAPAQEPREDNFETMPESAPRSKTPAPKTRADLAKLIHQELLSAGFKGANLWIRNEGTDREKARIYLSGKGRKQGMIEALSSQEYGSEGAFRLQVIQEEGLEGASEKEIQEAIDRRASALDLKLTPPKLDPEQLQRYLVAISAVARKLKDSAPKILDPSDRPTLALTLDYTETPLAQRSREELETLRTKAQQVNSRENRPQDKNENTHAVSVAQHIIREVNIALGETTAQTTQTTPRNELTETAQQIIEEVNQEHEERHEEHQEITKFELGEHTHTKTGQKLFTAKQKERTDRDEYFRRVEIAKKYKGRYERRYVKGFVFKTAEDARNFALEIEGVAQAPEASAETVTPHEDHPSADNFETMPEVESAPTQRLRGVLDALSESERLNTINPKNRKRPKEAKSADAKLIALVNELAEDQDPNDRRFLKVMASMLQDVKKRYPRSAYERQESRKDRYAAIREFIERKLDLEPTVTAPSLNEILSRPTTPNARPSSEYYGRATKKLVDQALSSEPTGFDPNRSGIDLPTKGDLREMLSQEQRLERAKEDLRGTGAPNFLGQKNPIQDIMYALSSYLNGPYVELEQERIREMERGLKIALRDSKGEELEQVKAEIARFWREWGGEYKRLHSELVTERTQGEALRNIRPLIPDHVLTPEINQLLDQMERELDQKPVSGKEVSEWIDTRDTNKATRDRQPTTPREQLTETAREARLNVKQIRAREAIKRARGAQTRIKTSNRADKLTATGRRARASINADKLLIEAIERIMDQDYREMERPLPSDINQRTPQQDNFAKLRGALNNLKSSQTLTRGSWTDDHESLKKKRIKARSEIEDALKDLETRSQEELQTQIQVNIEDLPPKGQRTAEDAKRFFGEPRKNEAIKRVTYERDGHIITGPASGRGKGKFRYDLSLPRERFRNEPLLATAQSSNEIGTYDTLDEALTAAINQYEPSDQIIDRMIESAKEDRERTARRMGATTQPTRTAHTIVLDRLIEAKRSGNEAQEAQINEQLRPQLLNLLEKLEQGTLDDGERQALLTKYQELETLTTGAGKELAQEIVSRLRGADNFETMPDEHKEFIRNKTREFSEELMHGLIYEETKRGKIRSLQRQTTGDMERALVKLALSGLRGKEVTNSNVKQLIAFNISGERAEETQGRLSALLSVGDTIEDKQDTLYKQALIEAADHIDEIAQGLATDDKDFTEAEHRAIKQRTAYLRALSAEIEIKDTQPAPDPSPARAQLAETVREISEPKSPLNIDQANAQDTLTEDRTRAPESKAADKALIESARELAKTSERGEEIKSALVDLMNAQQLKRYKRATGDMSARAEDMIEKRREARERLRAATSGEVINNFETMPETEAQPKKRTGPDISRYKRALSLAKKGKRLDKLTNGRRSKASREADQALIKLAQEILEKDLGDVEVRTIYRKPTTMWTREESLKVAISAMSEELRTRQRSLGGKGGADQAQELRADAREKLIEVIQEHVDRFLPDEVIDARLDRDLARDARETAKQEAREAQEARQYQQKTFTPEIQGAIDNLRHPYRKTHVDTFESHFKTRKDGGAFRTTLAPKDIATRITSSLPSEINQFIVGKSTLSSEIATVIEQGVEDRKTPAELKDAIGETITAYAEDNAVINKENISSTKAIIELDRNIEALTGTGLFDGDSRAYEKRDRRLAYIGLDRLKNDMGDINERIKASVSMHHVFRRRLSERMERIEARLPNRVQFNSTGPELITIVYSEAYPTVGDIRENISEIRDELQTMIREGLNGLTSGVANPGVFFNRIKSGYEKATEQRNKDREDHLDRAKKLAQYTENPQAHLVEVQRRERKSAQEIAEQLKINREFADAYIHEATKIIEDATENTKGELIDNLLESRSSHQLKAPIEGKANRKLMARIFNEVFEQVRREIGDEPIERGEKHPRNIADTVQKPSKTPAQFRDDIERAREEKRAQARAKREEVKARSATTVQKSLSAPKLTKMITYRAQLLQTIERLTA